MSPELLSNVSSYALFLLVWVLTFSHHGQGAALVAERFDGDSSNSPALASTSTSPTSVIAGENVPRAPPAFTWKTPPSQQWDRTWTGATACQSAPSPWASIVAQDGYEKMRADGGYNLLAVLCIFKDTCYAASIPRQGSQDIGKINAFINAQIEKCPEWMKLYGTSGTSGVQFHAEDLAIALAIADGHTFPIDDSGQPKAFMAVYGLYTGSETDRFGGPGPRWPCAARSGASPCTKTLTTLNIEFTYHS